MQQDDDLGLARTPRDVDAAVSGEGSQLGESEGVEILGDTEWTVTHCTCSKWDDLSWLLMVRNEADMYIGPDRTVLFDVLDAHIHRVLGGHAACGGDVPVPESPGG